MEVISQLRDQKDFTVDASSAGIDDIISRLKEDGIVIFPNFLSRVELDLMNEDFEALVKSTGRGIKKFPLEKGEGVGVTRKKFKESDFPSTAEFYNRPFMHQIASRYVHPTANLNSQIYVVRDVVGTTTYANDLHFDVKKCLKFFLYLNDVNANNGAFEFSAGTHKWVEDLRRSDRADEITFENRELSRQLPYSEEHVIPLEAAAGTLFVFDTDIFHRTGTTSMGERKIMRGHTYFDEVKDKDPIYRKTTK